MKKIRIVFFIRSAAPYGSNHAMINFLEVLIKKDVEPLIIMAEYGAICLKLDQLKIPYLKQKYNYSIYPSLKTFNDKILFIPKLIYTLILNFFACIFLLKKIKKFKADIIHTNIGPLLIGAIIARKLKIPHVWHIREYHDLYYHFSMLFSNKAFKDKLNDNYNYPIAITRGLYNHYSLKNKAIVINDGVIRKKIMPILPKEKYFLYVGRYEIEKGVFQLIDTFADFALTDSHFKLLMAGDGDLLLKNEMYSRIKKFGLQSRIELLGFKNDPYKLMSHAAALIVLSNYEGFGFSTIEAMYAGCLVIAKNSGGSKEIMDDDKLGILYDDITGLKCAMNEVAKGLDQYIPKIKKTQELVYDKYSIEDNAYKILKHYKNIMKESEKN